MALCGVIGAKYRRFSITTVAWYAAALSMNVKLATMLLAKLHPRVLTLLAAGAVAVLAIAVRPFYNFYEEFEELLAILGSARMVNQFEKLVERLESHQALRCAEARFSPLLA